MLRDAVGKISAKEGLRFEGKAIVFEGEDKALKAILNGTVKTPPSQVSPNHPHRIGFELGIGGHDVPVLTVRLRDQQTVARVFVMRRQIF